LSFSSSGIGIGGHSGGVKVSGSAMENLEVALCVERQNGKLRNQSGEAEERIAGTLE
jgi:hypothetical protein